MSLDLSQALGIGLKTEMSLRIVEREFQWESGQMLDFIKLKPKKGIRTRERV